MAPLCLIPKTNKVISPFKKNFQVKTLQEIKQFYEADLRSDLEQLEAEQRKKLRTARLLQALFLGFTVIGFIFLYRLTEYLSGSLIASLFIYISIFLWINSLLAKNLTPLYWNGIIQQTFHFVDKNLTYAPNEGIPEKVFKDSLIYLNKISNYKATHLLSGSIDGTMVTSSYIDSKEPSSRIPHTQLFMGNFFAGKLKKTLSGRTVLVPTNDPQVNTLGTITRMIMRPVEKEIQSWPRKRDPIIKIHNPDFERLFIIYGNDPDHTKHLLQRTLMQKIVNYQTKTKKHLLVSCVDSHLFLACQFQFSSFDFGVNKSIIEFEAIQDYFEDLTFFMSIIADIESNTKL